MTAGRLSGLAMCVFGAAFVAGCGSDSPDAADHQPPIVAEVPSGESLSPDVESRIERFCGDCHALPRPESFARDRWYTEVRKGYEFYAKSGRTDLDPPSLEQTLAWFRSRAPREMTFTRPEESTTESPVRFTRETIRLDARSGPVPEIAHLNWTRLAPHDQPILLACDMRFGRILAVDLGRDHRQPPRVLARLRNPAHAEVVDLDGDGADDVVVADLGSFMPADHDRGRVVLLQQFPDTEDFQEVELASGLGRVADVRPADVDGDRRIDLIVAEFGWRDAGGILWLRNVSTAADPLRFDVRPLDDRPGTIHVPIHDFNDDGRPDFAALLSQEHESVDLFLNMAGTGFVRVNVWRAPDLTFGSSGIELVDLNQDGNMDILMTNGDAFDNSYASPWHGVQWLENRGELDFVCHRLTDLPGAFRALPGDFDGDGDTDLVAVSFLPPSVQPAALADQPPASIVLLEQRRQGDFVRHSLESGAPVYATQAVGDFDGDGDLDFVVASGPNLSQSHQAPHAATVWWNQTIPDEP